MDNSEFSFLKAFKQLISDSLNDIILTDILFSNHIRVPFIAKDENEIKNILHKLVGNIFNFIIGSTKSQVIKEILGETTRSQTKKKIIEEYPNIDLGDLDLILQISPRIYRLLQVSNSNWILLNVFEEITPTFFKSKIKVGANFEIWLNLERESVEKINEPDTESESEKKSDSESISSYNETEKRKFDDDELDKSDISSESSLS
ncbi:hypothetical protein C1646_777772 [Rhizophagus diaphanus]|nr:hypothetical protein C1646_777772 [Rhizophagus diaphanus] [Rhizophagus sp. MUCL 43196]